VRLHFVLIDLENVKLEYIETLKHEHFRVFLFVGAHQQKLNLAIVKAVQPLGSNVDYIQISGQGSNALDFHISYYLGTLSAAHPDAYFHIISKDKGFDPLIKHLNDQKISCSRSVSVLEIPLGESTDKIDPRQRAADFYEKRIASTKARPATVKSLENTVLTHFHKKLRAEEVAKVLEALTASGNVVIAGKKVEYPEPHVTKPRG